MLIELNLCDFLGFFGAIISVIQISILEQNELKSIHSTTGASLPFFSFAVAMLLFYSFVPILLKVLIYFVSHFIGDLKEWWIALAQYRHTQLFQIPDIDQFMYNIYVEFLGSPVHIADQAREEFFKLKCCSFNPKI